MRTIHTNCTETVQPPSEVLYASNIALSVISAVIGVFAVVLNSLVMASIVKTPSLQHPANLWLCSLSASDLLVGLVVLPLYVAARLLMVTLDMSICVVDSVWNIYRFTLNVCSGVSFLQLGLISWDRYKAVSHPLVYRTSASKRRTSISIATSWLTWAALIAIVEFVVPQPYKNYILFLCGICFVFLPIVGQAATYKAIVRQNEQIIAADSQTTATALARENKVVITLRYITFAIFGCLVVPLVVFAAFMVTKLEVLAMYAFSWSMLFVYLNSCVNPVIYFWRHPDMRAAVRSLFGQWCSQQ